MSDPEELQVVSEKSQVELLKENLADPGFEKLHWEGRGIDQLLQWTIDMANGHKQNQFHVTLTVGGNLVSGILISADAYLDDWAEQFSSSFSADHQGEIRKKVLSWKREDLPLEERYLPAQFVHLKQAEVFTSSGRPILAGGSLWRGKLKSVDGFSLGSITVVEKS